MKTIVFGFDSYATVGSIRNLGVAGYRPVVILVSERRRTAAAQSKYLGDFIKVKDIVNGIEILMSLKSDGEKQYIFATSDKVATVLDEHYDELTDYYVFPNCGNKGELTRMMDKSTMCRIAEECGISIPWSIPYKIGQKIPVDITFPCLVKPRKSITGSKQDIRHFDSLDELMSFLSNNHKTNDYLIQKFIRKESEILIVGCRTSSGHTYLPAYHEKLRWLGDGDVGSFGYVKKGLPDGIEKRSIVKFLERLNYVGPFSIELGAENGKLFFFEINLRNDGTINFFTGIGINVSDIWLNDKMDVDPNFPSNAIHIDAVGDLLNVIKGNISIKQWWKDFRRASIYRYYDSSDKKPFWVFFPKLMRVNLATLYRRIIGKI